MRLRYDDSSDILVLQRTEGDPQERVDLGQIVLDMSSTNGVRGLEIRKASQFFKACKSELKKAKDADFYTTSKMMMLEITLKTRDCPKPARIAVPIELP